MSILQNLRVCQHRHYKKQPSSMKILKNQNQMMTTMMFPTVGAHRHYKNQTISLRMQVRINQHQMITARILSQSSYKQKMCMHDYQILPVVFVMANFRGKRVNKESWLSDPFFVSRDGCQMCLRVDASGYKTLSDTFISIYLYMIDFNDSNCNWPLLSGNFAI